MPKVRILFHTLYSMIVYLYTSVLFFLLYTRVWHFLSETSSYISFEVSPVS